MLDGRIRRCQRWHSLLALIDLLFFYFAVLGALLLFWSLYLQSIDYSAQEIGYVMVALAISRTVAPNIWGWLVDKTGQRLRIIRWGSCLAVMCFLGVFWQKSFAAMFAVVIVYSFFWDARWRSSKLSPLII